MDTVGIVGAGMMGSGIAEAVAVAGLHAIAYEPERAPLERSCKRIEASLEKGVARGKLQPDVAADARDAIVHTTHIEDLLGAEFVIEAVTEHEAIKTAVFGELDELVSPDVILASNTSSIPITTLAAATEHPDRVLDDVEADEVAQRQRPHGVTAAHGICTSMFEEFRRDEYSPPPLLRRMVSAGRLGRKTGHGFYDYAPVRAGAFA